MKLRPILVVACILSLFNLARAQSPQVAFEDDFEQDAKPQWSVQTTSKTPGGTRQFLGELGAGAVTLRLTDLPPHKLVRVRCDLLAIRSWDGNSIENGPDVFAITSDDGRVLTYTSIGLLTPQAFPGLFGVHQEPAASGAIERDTLGFDFKGKTRDAVFPIDCVLPHTGGSLELRFVAGADSTIADEAWGLDNVRVTLDDATVPATDELPALWEQLASDDPATASAAVQKLVVAGESAVILLAEKLKGHQLTRDLTLLHPARATLDPTDARSDQLYVLADASQRQIALAGHVLNLIGGDSAAAVVKSISPVSDSSADKTHAIRIVVRDEQTKQPMAGVPVHVQSSDNVCELLLTDAQGGALVRLSPQVNKARQIGVQVAATGYIPMNAYWYGRDESAAPPDEYVFEMEKGLTVGGRVEDDVGNPIDGAIVVLSFRSRQPAPANQPRRNVSYLSVQTGKDGTWTYPLAPSQADQVYVGTYHLQFENAARGSYPLVKVENVEELYAGKLVRVLNRGVRVEGVVYGPDGKPLAGAGVGWGTDRVASNVLPEQKTDEQGRFVFGAKSGDTIVLTVKHKRMAPDQKQLSVGPDGLKDIRFDLKPARTITGRVVDAAGKGIAGATVYTDTWRGARTLDTRLTTDSQGHFTWDSAPEDDVFADVVCLGYADNRKIAIRAGQENIVKLLSPMKVRGTVVDAQTGQPIPSFNVITGIDWKDGRAVYWQRRTGSRNDQARGKDGKFDLTLTYPYPAYAIRVEADGYMPADTEPFELDGTEKTFELKLSRGESITATITDPTGAPLNEAEVYLCTPSQSMQVINGQVPDHAQRDVVSVRSGADGRFSIPPQTDPYLLVVLHEKGCAKVKGETISGKDTKIALAPWASVEGVVKIGSRLAADATVSGWYNFPDEHWDEKSPRVHFSLDSRTDSEGRFKLDRVVPNADLSVGRQVQISSNMRTLTGAVRVDAKPGETVTIAIGGTGRPVVGRIALPETLASGAQAWMASRAMLSTPIEMPEFQQPEGYDDLSPQEKQEWYDKWIKTDAGQAYLEAQREAYGKQRSYPLILNTDGTFRADDVLPGTYQLTVSLAAAPAGDQCGFGDELAGATADVVVPDPGVPQSDEPYEVPTITAKSIKIIRLVVGDVAPAFDVPSLDGGKQIKLEDYRGKYVLLDFWAVWCGPCVAEIPHLKEAHQAFANDDRVVFISLSLDDKAETAQKFVEKQQMTWPQGFLGEWSKATVPNDYGLRGIPSVWLIGPDGKIIARDLRGAGVKTAIQSALGPAK